MKAVPHTPAIARTLVKDAACAVEQATGHLFHDRSIAELGPHSVHPDGTTLFRRWPTYSAVESCLASATALLAIAHALLEAPVARSAMERDRRWKKLACNSKTAGRAACRAALILSDPEAAAADAEFQDAMAPYVSLPGILARPAAHTLVG